MLCRFLTWIISKEHIFLYLLLLIVVNMYKHMGKVVIKILQGSAVTQTTLGGLTINPQVANFLQCIRAKNYENWLAVDKVIAKIIRLTFFGPPCSSFLSAPHSSYTIRWQLPERVYPINSVTTWRIAVKFWRQTCVISVTHRLGLLSIEVIIRKKIVL